MSYCRFSSDNCRCDLHCYESNYGYETHVASCRVVGEIPLITLNVGDDGWREQYHKQIEFLDNCIRELIDLPHAGESFIDGSLERFYLRVKYLKEIGYNVPDGVLESIKKEIDENEG